MKTRPNLLFLLSDDQGAWALGCAGNKEIQTPALDSIAENGMRFDNFYCVSPVCSPARASILSGTIPSVHGVQDWLRGGNLNMAEFPEIQGNPLYVSEHTAIPYLQDMTCFTDVLAENGYVCEQSAMTKPDAYEKAWCQALTDVVFEGETFKAPAEYDKFLTTLYGDYMQLPPEDKRENRHQIMQIDFGD